MPIWAAGKPFRPADSGRAAAAHGRHLQSAEHADARFHAHLTLTLKYLLPTLSTVHLAEKVAGNHTTGRLARAPAEPTPDPM